MYHQVGVGEQTVELGWYCSWASHAPNEAEEVLRALDRLSTLEQMSIWQYMDGVGYQLFADNLASARQGDLGPRFVEAAC